MKRLQVLGLTGMVIAVMAATVSLRGADAVSAGETVRAVNMELVGFHPLDGREAYWPTVHFQNGRWIVYAGIQDGEAVNELTGKKEPNGVILLDVTDPTKPKMLSHIPGPPPPDVSGTEHVRVCDGTQLPHGDPNKVYLLRSYGHIGHQLWDVTKPEAPALISNVVLGLASTHKSWWDCASGMAYIVGGPKDWNSSLVLMLYDISDPTSIKHVRDFGLAGMEPGGSGAFKQGLHGPILLGNRLYLAWGTSRQGVIQIVDNDKLLHGDPGVADPFSPTPQNLQYPEVGRLRMPDFWGAHTTFPVKGMMPTQFAHDARGTTRDYLVVTSEAMGTLCNAFQQLAWMVDITDEAHPFPVSTLSTPESGGDYCAAGGRFGPHAASESFNPAYYKKIVFLTYFNAGLRAFDIRDPLHPSEVASFIPATTAATIPTCTAKQSGVCKTTVSTNGVDVDDRGYIYIVDRVGTGLHILKLTGKAREIADGR